ncbi:hypothetical protein NE237_023387 [Protea cynaroides]|uniref:Oxidoreductase-like domain-containing protein n=1 Tax=Protea cynaroides TaxID=273540 RepID=A0A9Q0HC35_9MAGN|nr:hypothetical protein NE237_023387 [Protea cynaroides]
MADDAKKNQQQQDPLMGKKEKDKEKEVVEVSSPPPPPPEKPDPGDCCGSGCIRCVWDIYYDELEAYNNCYGKSPRSKSN